MRKFLKYAMSAIECGGALLLIIEGLVLALMALSIFVVALMDSESLFDFVFSLTAAGICGFLALVIFSMFKYSK